MTEFNSNKKPEITRDLKHKGFILCVIQHFGALLMVLSIIAIDGKFFGADISIDKDIIAICIAIGTGIMCSAHNSRRRIREKHTP